jgi:hypothetical protein
LAAHDNQGHRWLGSFTQPAQAHCRGTTGGAVTSHAVGSHICSCEPQALLLLLLQLWSPQRSASKKQTQVTCAVRMPAAAAHKQALPCPPAHPHTLTGRLTKLSDPTNIRIVPACSLTYAAAGKTQHCYASETPLTTATHTGHEHTPLSKIQGGALCNNRRV